jgi:alanyl aminopeptidase
VHEAGGNLHILRSTLEIVVGLDNDVIGDQLRPAYARFVRKLYGDRAHALGWKPQPGEDEDAGLLRRRVVQAVANQGEDPALIEEAGRLVRRWLDDRTGIDADMLDVALDVAARHGDRALFDRFVAEARRSKPRLERRRLIDALASFEDPALVARTFDLFLHGDFDPRESTSLLFGGRRANRRRHAGALSFQFVKGHYDAILARMPQGTYTGGEFAAALPWTAADICDQRQRAEVESFFRDRSGKALGGARVLAQVLERISLCAHSASAQRDSVAAFLRNW